MLLGLSGDDPVTACSSPPVGWGLPTGRRQTTVSLPVGTEACFFSDGLIEARREGQLLGRERLREILTVLGSGAVAEELLAEVRAAAQGAPDDMVACVLSPQVSGGKERVHVEELEVDASMLGRAGVRRFLRDCAIPADVIAATLRAAADAAGNAGTALLRVDLAAGEPTVTVSRTGSAAQAPAGAADESPLANVPAGMAGTLQARALA
jgi:hypothetical protein